CSAANGFSPGQMQQTRAGGGNTRLGTMNLVRTASSSADTVDKGSAAFGMYTPAQLSSSLGPTRMPSLGTCVVFPFSGASPAVSDPTQPQALDAGTAISVSRPTGAQQLTPVQGGPAGTYGAQFASGGTLYLDPGTYTLTSAGGADVGAIQGQVVMPPVIAWSNAPSTSIDRTQGLTVAWTGGDPN